MIRRSLTLLRWLRQHLGRCALAVALAVLVVVGAAEAGLQGRALYHFRAARLAAEHHRLRAARQHLDACLGAWPRSAPAHLLAAQVARWSGALDDAERHLEAAEQREGDRTPAARLERVLLQAQRGDLPPEAETYLRSFAERGAPEAPLILEGLSAAYLEVLRPSAAEDCPSRCLRLQPDDLPALLLRGRARERQSNIEAVDDYRRALELDPADDGARLRLAGALFTFGRADEAVAHYEMLQRRRLDVFVTGGGSFDKTDAEYRADPAHPPRIQGRPCKLYRNLGAWKFQDVTAATGLDRIPFYSHGGRPRITTATAGPTCW